MRGAKKVHYRDWNGKILCGAHKLRGKRIRQASSTQWPKTTYFYSRITCKRCKKLYRKKFGR